MDPNVDKFNSVFNYILTVYFLVEMIIKLVGLGLKRYFSERMNVFDTFVVVSSCGEMAIDLSGAASGKRLLQ